MIGYATLATHDLSRSAAFYDALFLEVGAKRTMEHESFIAWSTGLDQPGFAVTTPFNSESVTVGNGVMIALALENPQQVDALYAKAIELGAKDEGASGPRGGGSYYAGYFRDLDGNKLNFFCMMP